MDVFRREQLKIARATLRMSDTGALVMGGMTKAEARTLLGLQTADLEIDEEIRNEKEKDSEQP